MAGAEPSTTIAHLTDHCFLPGQVADVLGLAAQQEESEEVVAEEREQENDEEERPVLLGSTLMRLPEWGLSPCQQ